MTRTYWRSERGSVTPVWVFILGMVVLLGVAVVEREWANVKLKLLVDNLDFAAEAAGRTHEGWARVDVPMQQFYYVDVCVENDLEGNCIDWEPSLRGPRRRTQPIEGRVSDVRDNWRSLAGCGGDSMEPSWGCLTPVVQCQWLEFTSDLEQAAEQTFWGNWKNLPTAYVHPSSLFVMPDLAGPCVPVGSVAVSAEIEMRPLFGLVPWAHRTVQSGGALVRLKPLVLQ